MTGRLKDKVAIVTGAGSVGPGWGNGKAAATLFAREGAKVFAVDLSIDAAVETKRIVDGEGGACTVHAADVSRSDEVRALVERCISVYGRIDILHNNVGIVEVGGPVETSEESWDRVVRVNMKSMFLTCKFVLPQMVKQFEAGGRGGAIVNISSVAGIRWTGVPYISYTTSKGAVIPFTRAIALQYARQGIRCNCILPGLMNTPMIVAPLKDVYGGGDVQKMIDARDAQCPTGKMGDAWDVAYAALFLACDEAKYVTGVALPVDGGITLKYA
ncbi:MAG TPA: SDR family oxidoreductase [Alphaproteobacteria bacterium]|nr:SDR family oxidoreductase [Alphaproteobacteria bacterium]